MRRASDGRAESGDLSTVSASVRAAVFWCAAVTPRTEGFLAVKMVKLSAVAAIAATAALLASATPSLAQGPSGPSAITPEVKALMATQDKLHKIADRFDRGNGFGGLSVDAGSKTLNVYW